MTTITINEKTFEVKFSFKAIKNALNQFKLNDLTELSDFATKVVNVPALLQIGINSVSGQEVEIETIDNWLDAGSFERLKEASEILNNEIVAYFKATEKNDSATMSA